MVDLNLADATFLQHLGALFKVVAEVNHKPLARELLIAIQKFRQLDSSEELINQILTEPSIRSSFKDLVRHLKASPDGSMKFIDTISQLRSPKRGRKPSFTRAGNIGTMGQVTFLGGLEVARAS